MLTEFYPLPGARLKIKRKNKSKVINRIHSVQCKPITSQEFLMIFTAHPDELANIKEICPEVIFTDIDKGEIVEIPNIIPLIEKGGE